MAQDDKNQALSCPSILRISQTASGIHGVKNASIALKNVVRIAGFRLDPGVTLYLIRVGGTEGLLRSPYHLLFVLIKNIGFSFTFNHGLIDNHLGDVIQ